MKPPKPLLPNTREALDQRFPHLIRKPTSSYPLGTIALGRSNGKAVALGPHPLLEHTHVIGTTGGGKTNFLELMIRQMIVSGAGVFVLDPHGAHRSSLYNSLINFLFERGYHKSRRIHLLDPNAASHTTGFNPLALPDADTNVSVIADTTLEAFERVWGDEQTHAKPTIRRVLKATFAALAELHLTLPEAELLYDHRDTIGVRTWALANLKDRYARAVLGDLDQIARSDRTGARFRDELIGPINRLAEFTSSPAIRRIIGQRENTLDLQACLDNGDIVLANLSGGNAVSDADTELLGRLLTRFLFFHAKRRKTDKPAFLIIDECQRFLSGDVPNLLAECRKFKLGVVASHQWQSQLGGPDDQTLAAVQNATNLKVSFRVKHPKEAAEIAEAIIPLDLETPVRALIKPTVVGHRRTYFDNWSESETDAWGIIETDSYAETDSEADTENVSSGITDASAWSSGRSGNASQSWTYDGAGFGYGTPSTVSLGRGTGWSTDRSGSHAENSSIGGAHTSSHSVTAGRSVSVSDSHATSSSRGASEGLEPIYRDLPSAVHSKDNALYFAAQMLRSLTAGEAYASFVDQAGMHSARIQVPLVRALPVSEATFVAIRTLILSKSASATETAHAIAALEDREQKLIAEARRQPELSTEPQFRVPAPKSRRPRKGSDQSGG
jgi:hypothetical protein